MDDRSQLRQAFRLCHISSVHRADDPRILTKECSTLAAAGYDVRLVAPEPTVETPTGVRHVAIQRRKGRLRRILVTVSEAYRAAVKQRPVAYHLHDPELLPLGILLRLKAPVIYDAHEDIGNQVRHKPWIPSVLRPLIAAVASMWERLLARRMSAVIAATPTIQKRFGRRRATLVRNLARVDEFKAIEEAPAYQDRQPIVAYVGSLSAPRGAREMVAAIGMIEAAQGAVLRMAGEPSPPTLVDELAMLQGWSSVRMLGWQDRQQVASLLGTARIGLVCLHPTPSYIDSYPVKLFEYMAAGIPVVASDFPLWRSIVADADCGLLVDPLDPAAIASAITELLADPMRAERLGRNGRSAVETRWNWQTEGARLVTLYDRLLGVTGSPAVSE